MNMIRLPVPNEYTYIDLDKITTLDFNAETGGLTIGLLGEINRVYFDSAKVILDKILTSCNCTDGIPKIPKQKNIKKSSDKEPIIVEADLCDLIT